MQEVLSFFHLLSTSYIVHKMLDDKKRTKNIAEERTKSVRCGMGGMGPLWYHVETLYSSQNIWTEGSDFPGQDKGVANMLLEIKGERSGQETVRLIVLKGELFLVRIIHPWFPAACVATPLSYPREFGPYVQIFWDGYNVSTWYSSRPIPSQTMWDNYSNILFWWPELHVVFIFCLLIIGD